MGSLEEEKKVKDLGSQFPSFFLVNAYEELNEGSCAACTSKGWPSPGGRPKISRSSIEESICPRIVVVVSIRSECTFLLLSISRRKTGCVTQSGLVLCD